MSKKVTRAEIDHMKEVIEFLADTLVNMAKNMDYLADRMEEHGIKLERAPAGFPDEPPAIH